MHPRHYQADGRLAARTALDESGHPSVGTLHIADKLALPLRLVVGAYRVPFVGEHRRDSAAA